MLKIIHHDLTLLLFNLCAPLELVSVLSQRSAVLKGSALTTLPSNMDCVYLDFSNNGVVCHVSEHLR